MGTLARLVAVLSFVTIPAAAAEEGQKYLYTMDNNQAGNGVIVLERLADGSLKEVPGSPFATGGKGLGSQVDEQGAVRIHGEFLLTVNPGSNTIAVLQREGGGKLKPVPGSPFHSGGDRPLSLAVKGDLVYVANQAGQRPNITGFHIDAQGRLAPIAKSTIAYKSGEGAVQVEFSPKGGVLGVSELGGGKIRTYAVEKDGLLKEGPGSPFVTGQKTVHGNAIGGNVGFSFTRSGHHLLVSSFADSTVTDFAVDGKTAALSPPRATFPNRQNAACWTALSPDGETIYTANIGNATLSAYSLRPDETLSLRGSTPPRKGAPAEDTTDIELSSDGKFLYLVAPKSKEIVTYDIGADRIPHQAAKAPFKLKSAPWALGLALN